MTDELKDKAINIKGKQYVLVSDRVLHFNSHYPNGSIETLLVSHDQAERVVVKAIVKPDASLERVFTGYSQAKWEGYINAASALENAETSAVGRALAMMGIGVIDSIASQDEINKATDKSSLSQEEKTALIAKKTAILTEDIAKQQRALETNFFGEQERPTSGATVTITGIGKKTSKKGKEFYWVAWKSGIANCWDSKLHPFLALQKKGDSIRIGLQQDGDYSSIVSVASATVNQDAEDAE